jgi:transposase
MSFSAAAFSRELSPQHLFCWRRQFRGAAGGHSEAKEVQFVPALKK